MYPHCIHIAEQIANLKRKRAANLLLLYESNNINVATIEDILRATTSLCKPRESNTLKMKAYLAARLLSDDRVGDDE